MKHVAYVGGLMLMGCLIVGCAVPTMPTPTAESVRQQGPGEDAADIARARAHAYALHIETLRKQRNELTRQKNDLLAEARLHREHAARASRNMALSAKERKVEMSHLAYIARERETQARRFAQIAASCNERASRLESKRQVALRDAARFDKLVCVPAQ